MSQYGAMGFAEHGFDAAAILAHYYTGTALGTTDPAQKVRVLLATGSKARIAGARAAGTRKLEPGRDLHGQAPRRLASSTCSTAPSASPRSRRRCRSRAPAA